METFWNLFEQLLSLWNVLVQDWTLVIHHRQKKSVSIDVKRFVDEIEPILFTVIAKDVVLFVSIAKFHDSTSNQVVDSSPCIDESEAVVWNPKPRVNHVSVLINEFKCHFKSVFVFLTLTLSNCLVDCSLVVFEQIEGIFKSKNYHLTIFGPKNVLKILSKVYSSYNVESLPIVESDKVFASDSK